MPEVGFLSGGQKFYYQDKWGADAKPDTLDFEVLKDRFPEIWRDAFDPRQFSTWTCPPETQAALEDVFGEEARSGRVIVALHPHHKRPALFELCTREEGQPEEYRCFWICGLGEALHDEYVASDYDPQVHWSTRGQMGEFRLPTKFDFETVKRHADTRSGMSQAERVAMFDQDRVDRKAELSRRLEDREDAKVDYELWRQRIVPTVSMHQPGEGLTGAEKAARARTTVFTHKGYAIRVPCGSDAELRYLEEMAAARLDKETVDALASKDAERLRKILAVEVRDAEGRQA